MAEGHFKLDDTPLQAVLGALPSLYRIDLRGTGLGPQGAAQLAAAAASTMLRLTALDLANNQLGDEGLCHIAKVVLTTTQTARSSVNFLDVGWNRISLAGAGTLAEMLCSKACALTLLDLECNDLADAGTVRLSTALPQCIALRILRLGGNRIGGLGGKSLAAAVQCAPSLENLDVSRNYLGPRGAEAFAEALRSPVPRHHEDATGTSSGQSWTVSSLYLSVNRIRDEGAEAFAHVLGQSGKCAAHVLDVLDLGANQIGDAGARALAEALAKGLACLRWLGLAHNKLSSDGGKAVAEAFEDGHNWHMQTINLMGNEVGSEAPARISATLRRNIRSIVPFDPLRAAIQLCTDGGYKIDLKGVMLGIEEACSLADAMRSRRARVQELLLGNTALRDEGVSLVVAGMKQSLARVTELDMSWNRISLSGAEQLGQLLMAPGGSSLTFLDLECNNLGDEGVAKLLSSFNAVHDSGDAVESGLQGGSSKVDHPLHVLRLGGNGIGPAGARHLVAAFRRGLRLAKLDLGRNRIGRGGAEAIATVLAQPDCPLCELGLAVNRLGDAGAAAVVHGWASMENSATLLRDLNLNSNFIGDEGAVALAKALEMRSAARAGQQECPCLTVHLEFNKITPIGGEALSAVPHKCHSEVKLAHNLLTSGTDIASSRPQAEDDAVRNKRQRFS